MQPRSIMPKAGPAAYQTYEVRAPLSTHHRRASCAEADCPHYLNGWRVRTDGLSEQMIHTATHSGRKFTELHVSETENWLVFEAGQACFAASTHTVRLDKPEVFLLRGGDWRGNPRQVRRTVLTPGSWVDGFGEHQERIRDLIERG